jgi:hypothetical protein
MHNLFLFFPQFPVEKLQSVITKKINYVKCQSHTGRLTGLWFLPKPAFGLNTNDDDDDDDIM